MRKQTNLEVDVTVLSTESRQQVRVGHENLKLKLHKEGVVQMHIDDVKMSLPLRLQLQVRPCRSSRTVGAPLSVHHTWAYQTQPHFLPIVFQQIYMSGDVAIYISSSIRTHIPTKAHIYGDRLG
jgi:hypothetical protein